MGVVTIALQQRLFLKREKRSHCLVLLPQIASRGSSCPLLYRFRLGDVVVLGTRVPLLFRSSLGEGRRTVAAILGLAGAIA